MTLTYAAIAPTVTLVDIRCTECRKLLARRSSTGTAAIEIKCPRCTSTNAVTVT